MQLNLVAEGQPEVVSAMNLHCINLVAVLIESNHKINLNRGAGMDRIKKTKWEWRDGSRQNAYCATMRTELEPQHSCKIQASHCGSGTPALGLCQVSALPTQPAQVQWETVFQATDKTTSPPLVFTGKYTHVSVKGNMGILIMSRSLSLKKKMAQQVMPCYLAW